MLDADFEVERRDFTVRAALQVGPGERLALFGPSGAGKTTLLEVIAGLVQPNRGRVVLRGKGADIDVATALRTAPVAAPGRFTSPGSRPVPSPIGHAEPHVLALAVKGRRRLRTWPRCWGWATCSRSCRGGCSGGRPIEWRWVVCCWRRATRCCWTSRTRAWTPASGGRSRSWS